MSLSIDEVRVGEELQHGWRMSEPKKKKEDVHCPGEREVDG